jgi:soluble lytic murein transglycosylase
MLKKKILIFILFFITACLCCFKNGNGDELSPELAAKSFYTTPEQKIRQIEKNSNNFQKNFILAKAYKEKKEFKNAILYFANSCFINKFSFSLRLFADPVYLFVESPKGRSIFYNDSIFEIASIFYNYNEHEYVIKFIDLIKENDSALYRDLILLKSKSYEKLNQFQKTIEELKKLSGRFTDSESMSQIYMRMAAVYESAGNFLKAADTYFQIIKCDNSSWENAIAAKRLTYLIREKNIKPDSTEKLVYYASALYDARDYDKALIVLDSIPGNEKKLNTEVIKIKILTKKNYQKSLTFLKQKNKDPDYEKLFLEHANILWDSRKKSLAVKCYEQLTPSADNTIAGRVLTRLSFYYEERNRPELVIFMENYIKRFPENSLNGRFTWLIGRYYMRKGDKAKAVEYFKTGIKKYPGNSYTSYSRFWLNKITGSGSITDEMLEELASDNPDTYHAITLLKKKASESDNGSLLGKFREAKKNKDNRSMLLYHTLLFMKNGYDTSAADRIKQLDSQITGSYKDLASILDDPDYKSGYKSLLKRLENYFLAGDIDSVNREIKLIPEKDQEAQKDLAVAMIVYASKYGYFNYSSFYGFRLLALLKIKENLSLIPPVYAKILYPYAFSQCVNDESARYRVRRELLLSMMKVESNYNHNAVSPAGATGLMQLMPYTARGIARELKLKKPDLRDPCISIKFGAYYISWLNRYFNGRIEYMVSGYNAGAGNVDRWKKKDINKDMDLFSEFTPYDETRDYIFRTKKYMIQYELIYKGSN